MFLLEIRIRGFFFLSLNDCQCENNNNNKTLVVECYLSSKILQMQNPQTVQHQPHHHLLLTVVSCSISSSNISLHDIVNYYTELYMNGIDEPSNSDIKKHSDDFKEMQRSLIYYKCVLLIGSSSSNANNTSTPKSAANVINYFGGSGLLACFMMIMGLIVSASQAALLGVAAYSYAHSSRPKLYSFP